MRGFSSIGDYLTEIVADYAEDTYAWSKVIWDVASIAFLVNAAWTPSELVHSPILSDQLTWSVDHSRHLIRTVNYVKRDPIFADLFRKLKESGG